MRSVLIATPSEAQIPLGQVARVSFSHGPAMIRDEDGQLTGYVYIDLKGTNYGGFVDEANRKLQSQVARVSFSHGPAMIRDEDGQLTGYVYIDLKGTNYGGFVDEANRKLQSQVA